VWGVFDATTGDALACVGLHPTHQPGMREVGFWALPEARGAGVVSEAVSTVARWAFAELGLARLEWATEVGNAASLRVAVKAGFAFEGRRRASLHRRDGSRVDGWWAARLPADGPDGAPPALPWPGVLRAGDLRLRPWRSDDAEALTAAIGDERPPLPPPPPGLDTAGHARWFTGERAPEWWASGAGAPLAVLTGDGAVVGSLQLFLAGRRAGIAEVGVWLTSSARRQGVGTRAVQAQLDWAVPALGLSRVEWHAPRTTRRRSRWPSGWASSARAWRARPSPATPGRTTSSWPGSAPDGGRSPTAAQPGSAHGAVGDQRGGRHAARDDGRPPPGDRPSRASRLR
jgi:RimJ/RimL family protein N-acetyltransferase